MSASESTFDLGFLHAVELASFAITSLAEADEAWFVDLIRAPGEAAMGERGGVIVKALPHPEACFPMSRLLVRWRSC